MRYYNMRDNNLRKVSGFAYASASYRSTDINLIYHMEYCKVRNKQIYNQLNNSNTRNSITKYRSLSPNNYEKMLEAYGRTQLNADIISFENRKKAHEAQKRIEQKDTPVQLITTKKQEVNAFKDSIRKQANLNKPTFDKVVYDFEVALRERKKYDEELKKNGYRVINGRKNSVLKTRDIPSTGARDTEKQGSATQKTAKQSTTRTINTKNSTKRKNTVITSQRGNIRREKSTIIKNAGGKTIVVQKSGRNKGTIIKGSVRNQSAAINRARRNNSTVIKGSGRNSNVNINRTRKNNSTIIKNTTRYQDTDIER